jgi:hypothetical protein
VDPRLELDLNLEVQVQSQPQCVLAALVAALGQRAAGDGAEGVSDTAGSALCRLREVARGKAVERTRLLLLLLLTGLARATAALLSLAAGLLRGLALVGGHGGRLLLLGLDVVGHVALLLHGRHVGDGLIRFVLVA